MRPIFWPPGLAVPGFAMMAGWAAITNRQRYRDLLHNHAMPALIIIVHQRIEWVFSATSERWKHACEDLEPQIFLVAQALCAVLDDADLVVEALDEAEREFVFRLAVGGDAIPMPIGHLGELFIRFEPLPLQA